MTMFRRSASWLSVMAILLFALAAEVSAATAVCFGANITRVGSVGENLATGNSGFRFEVEGGSCAFAANTPFFLSTETGKGGLAILLTAFSLGNTVTMVVPAPVTANSLVFKIHVDGQ